MNLLAFTFAGAGLNCIMRRLTLRKYEKCSTTAVTRTIVLSVTSEQSLKLMAGLPERLAAWGWDVHIVVSRASGVATRGVTWHELPMRREPAVFRDLAALSAWIKVLVTIRPQVVMAGTPKAGLLGTLAAAIVRVPVRIYVLRGLRCSSERGLKRTILGHVERLTATASTTVLAVSHSLRQEYVDLGFAQGNKVVVLGQGSSNGVDTSRGAILDDSMRRQIGLSDAAFVVGYVGRVTEDKGVEMLIKAVHSLAERDVAVRLLVVGPEEPNGILNQCIEASGVKKKELVVWTGEVASVDRYYQAMDVLCLPTRREGFPNVVLEAAMHGLPTVATRVTGCVDAIVDGRTGILVDPDNPTALTESLAYLSREVDRRRVMGQAARRRAIEEFDQEKVWSRISRFLDVQAKLN